MIGKIKTLAWFAKRPTHWRHALSLFKRKFDSKGDLPEIRSQARAWAANHVVQVSKALEIVGLVEAGENIPKLDPMLIRQAKGRAARSQFKMGGGGDLELIYSATKLSDSQVAIETGVAYGWSSLAILAGLGGRKGVQLISVDMPYPKMGNDKYVGIVVPEEFRKDWLLIREPDRYGIKKAIARMNRPVDLTHYDSDKSYQGRCYAYPLLWGALREGGVFISDDIQDNMAFKEFVEAKGSPFAVTEFEGKYVGITRKLSPESSVTARTFRA